MTVYRFPSPATAFSASRSHSPAFAARESSEFPGRDFSVAEAVRLRARTATDHAVIVDRRGAYDEAAARIHKAKILGRRAHMHLVVS